MNFGATSVMKEKSKGIAYKSVDTLGDAYCFVAIERNTKMILAWHLGRRTAKETLALTNAFSKKWENLKASFALHFTFYNFCRMHKAIRCTPAMEGGLTNDVWSLAELIGGQ
jgi:hypothetical protein